MTTLRCGIYKDSGGRWRWRIVAANGRKVASSGEAFASKSNARRALNLFLDRMEQGVVA